MDAWETVQYVDFDERYLDGMLDIATARFGENYINREEILSIANKDDAMCSIAVDKETREVLGYCLFLEENMESASKAFKIPKEEMISVTGSDSTICHIKSLAVRKWAENRGLGHNLFQRTLDKAKKIGYKVAWCAAWKRGDYIPAREILLYFGFKYFKTVHGLWENNKNFRCIYCKGPCKCADVIYYKILN